MAAWRAFTLSLALVEYSVVVVRAIIVNDADADVALPNATPPAAESMAYLETVYVSNESESRVPCAALTTSGKAIGTASEKPCSGLHKETASRFVEVHNDPAVSSANEVHDDTSVGNATQKVSLTRLRKQIPIPKQIPVPQLWDVFPSASSAVVELKLDRMLVDRMLLRLVPQGRPITETELKSKLTSPGVFGVGIIVCIGACIGLWKLAEASLQAGDVQQGEPEIGRGSGGLYLSHMLSQFGDRMWQFAVPVLFISVWDGNLLPSAIFGFILYGLKVVCLPFVGVHIDETDRLTLVKHSTFGQCVCTCSSVLLLLVLGYRVHRSNAEFASSMTDTSLFLLLIVIGVAGDLCATAGTISVEKDWVVVISASNEEMLQKLTVTLRRIDLFCKLVAPLFFGIIVAVPMTKEDQVVVGSVVVAVWSLLSTLPIYLSWKSVYDQYPALQIVKPPKKARNPFAVLLGTGVVYFNHPVFGASFAYCCLYFTVLSDHHPLTTAFLLSDGVSAAGLGFARASGALCGIIGTYAYPYACNCFGGHVSASVAAAWGFVMIIGPISILWQPGSGGFGVHAVLMAITFSRIFLWCFDLGNVQTMQESVDESQRGEMGAAQNAMCQVMELIMATLSMFYADQFRVLVLLSVVGVTSAAVLLSIWAAWHHEDPRVAVPASNTPSKKKERAN